MAFVNDWAQLRGDIEKALRAQLGQLAESVAADLDGPIREAANRLTVAVRSGKQNLVDETKDQLALLFLSHKLKAKSGLNGIGIDLILGTGINLLVNGAISGIRSVKTK